MAILKRGDIMSEDCCTEKKHNLMVDQQENEKIKPSIGLATQKVTFFGIL
jgi:hypothetical protein